MIKINFQNQSAKRRPAGLDEKKWLKKVINILAKNLSLPQAGVIEFYLVNEQEIRKLNKKYRKKDKVTDVLSFSFLGQESFPGEDLVGQIFLCPQIALKQATEHQVTYREESEFLFVHALLHVFGMDHENPADFRQMFKLQLKLFPEIKWLHYVQLIFRQSFPPEEF